MNTSSLLKLSDQVLALDSNFEGRLLILQEYTEKFSDWLRDHNGDIRPQNEKDFSELKKLAEQHALILKFAEESKSQLVEELRQIELRGKAIMAYIDQAPKRISNLDVKKG